MSAANLDIEQLSDRTGISKPLLVKRLTQGSFKMRELATLAEGIGCAVTDLTIVDGRS